MKTEISLQQILQAVNVFLPPGSAQVEVGNVVFAWEKDVDFQANARRVPRASLVPAGDFPGPFADSFAAGPDWINASAIPIADDRFLITIAAGRGVGNPRPSINVSHELNKRADITVTKDIVTRDLIGVN